MTTSELVKKEITDHQDWPSKTLARRIYALNPQGFISLTRIYDMVRYYRGARGKESREKVTHKYGKTF